MKKSIALIFILLCFPASGEWRGSVFLYPEPGGYKVFVSVKNINPSAGDVPWAFTNVADLAHRGILSAYCGGQKLEPKGDPFPDPYSGVQYIERGRIWHEIASFNDIFSGDCESGYLAVVLTGPSIIASKAFVQVSEPEPGNCIDITVSAGETSFELEVINSYAHPVMIDPMNVYELSDGIWRPVVDDDLRQAEIVADQIELLVPGEWGVFALPGVIASTHHGVVCYRGLRMCSVDLSCD